MKFFLNISVEYADFLQGSKSRVKLHVTKNMHFAGRVNSSTQKNNKGLYFN